MSKWVVDIHGDIEGDYEIIEEYKAAKNNILDEIKEEVLKYKPVNPNAMCPFEFRRGAIEMQLRVLQIIDKYKESEE